MIKKYKIFLKSKDMNEQDIHSICEKYNITNYKVNPDKSIDVDGGVNLYLKKLTKLPLKFNSVNGDFHCNTNQLTSLEGAPQSVGGDFDCNTNQLTSLKGAPESVGNFNCDNNLIYEIWKLFKDKSKIEFFNDYDMIIDDYEGSGKPAVILDRLNSFLLDIGKKVEGYINI